MKRRTFWWVVAGSVGLSAFPLVAWADPVGPFTWSTKAPVIPITGTGVEGSAASVIGDKIYVSHGFSARDTNAFRIYTISSDSWAFGPDASIMRAEMGGATDGVKHYAIGGRPLGPAGNAVEIFDPRSNTWSIGASMPTPRAGFCTAVLGGRIHAIGGRTGGGPNTGTPLSSHEVYDPDTNSWSTAADLPTAVGDNYACTSLRGHIYVFGGYIGNGLTGLTQIYDGATNSWSMGAPMPTARSNAIAGVLDCHPVVIGGVTGTGGNTSIIEIYHPDTDSWTVGPDKPTRGSEFSASMPGAGTEIFAIGSGLGISSDAHEALAGGVAGCPEKLDHFKCYESEGASPNTTVSLEDQFGVEPRVGVKKPKLFCNPVDKNQEGISDTTAHLAAYDIEGEYDDRNDDTRQVVVKNQFGEHTLRVKEPELLFVPSEKDGVTSPLGLDHFKCYESEGASPNTTVSLEDQFGVKPRVGVKKPKLFCNPVSKNHEKIKNPADHLTCYQIKGRGKERKVLVRNQFGEETLEVDEPRFLCVPSQKLSVVVDKDDDKDKKDDKKKRRDAGRDRDGKKSSNRGRDD